eukprot:1159882-Pelagomonas_calceolata.AAC.3
MIPGWSCGPFLGDLRPGEWSGIGSPSLENAQPVWEVPFPPRFFRLLCRPDVPFPPLLVTAIPAITTICSPPGVAASWLPGCPPENELLTFAAHMMSFLPCSRARRERCLVHSWPQADQLRSLVHAVGCMHSKRVATPASTGSPSWPPCARS